MLDEYYGSMNEDFEKAIESYKITLNSIRTGRASPQLIEGVSVNVSSYGAKMPLKQLATINAPDARLLVVNPWDKGTLNDIEKSIRSAGLGLNPSNDGQIIRVPIPPLTGERRKELARKVRQVTEDSRVRVRLIRREYNDLVKELESEKEISEDESRRAIGNIQSKTDETIKQLEAISKEKEKEVMEV